MPHIEYQTPWIDTQTSVTHYVKDTKGTTHLTARGDSYRGAKAEDSSLEIYINNDDWSYCTPFDGARLSLNSSGIPPAEGPGIYQTNISAVLSWDEIRRLHGFLGYLLSQMDAMRISPEDAKAAAENPD